MNPNCFVRILKFVPFLVIGLLFMVSCLPEEQRFSENPNIRMRFSQDTVIFDTVFTSIGSITKRFQVYNDDPNAIRVDQISLGEDNSFFNLTINGIESSHFENARILGGDSLLVLVDVLIDPMDSDLPFIVEDKVIFNTGTNMQTIDLVAWGQDANFLADSILECNTIWDSDRPYVIYNSVLVDSLCTLTINPGTRVFSHFGSSIFIRGTLNALGSSEERISFTNDRLDEGFRDAPGQWEGITFLPGSKVNKIQYSDIRNSTYGVWLGTPDADTIQDLTIENTIFENISRTGIITFTSDMVVENTLVNNTGEFAVANLAGGNYRYDHCSFANFPITFFRENEVFAASNFLELSDGSNLDEDLNLTISNSIIWGNLSEELILVSEGSSRFNILLESNILKTLQDFTGSDNLLNIDPQFIDPSNFDYRLDTTSPAINATRASEFLIDLLGASRDSIPDIGAYEFR